MKSTRFLCLALMIKYISKAMDRVSYGLGRVNYKNSYLNNYSEKVSCQANCFNFQSNQDSFFCQAYQIWKSQGT